MLTPKRVLMLVGGLVLFVTGYGVYSFFLGGINGLPPLPIAYLPNDDEPPVPPSVALGQKDQMIKMAFGEECVELGRPIRLLVRDKGVVLAAGQFAIEEDGRVKLAPFSAALFPKSKNEGPYPEINTVQCDFAFLTLDRPVSLPSELANRKVVGVELRGERGVTLTNNRRTPQKNDDLEVLVTASPLYFDERRNLIWADGVVKLLDMQPQPHPTKITAHGMELHLAKDATGKKAGAAGKAKGENVNGVELLVLRSNVDMHLWIDADDGFPGNADDFAPGAKKAKPPVGPVPKGRPRTPPEKSHIIISTFGPFTYDLTKDVATFDSPPPTKDAVPLGPDQVQVMREHAEKKLDHLICDHLTLYFRKKATNPGPREPGTGTGDREIERAVATSRPGRDVVLTMDKQELEAIGSELQYYCAKPGCGPQTVLKGAKDRPVRAAKASHKILATELHLTGNDKNGEGQKVYALGPGQIDVFDKTSPDKYPTHIRWRQTLVSSREHDGNRPFDLWTLTGDAKFTDTEHKQELHGERLLVWLHPDDPATRAKVRASGAPRQEVHKIEAFDRVFARTAEAVIKRTDRLTICFRPVVGADEHLPTIPEPPAPKTATTAAVVSRPAGPEPTVPAVAPSAKDRPAQPAVAVLPAPPPSPGGPAPAPAAKKQKERRPVELSADDVVIYVASLGPKKQLQEMIANGKVHVHQDGEDPKAKPGEKGSGLQVDGALLNLLHDPKGDTVVVFGDGKNLARMEMGDMKLWGPKVTVNQATNVAEVDGIGALEMPSDTSFDGTKPGKKDTRMTIHWNKNMQFDGLQATFMGGVVGYQDNASLKCDRMEAKMDRRIVFRDGQPQNKGSKVDRVICYDRVYVLDEQRDPKNKDKVLQASVLECKALDVDNLYGPTTAPGPGRLRHLALGDSDPNAAGRPAGTDVKAPREMMLTRIDYQGSMFSNTKQKGKNAKFYDNVELFRVPSETMDVRIDPDKLPKGGFYLRSEKLQMAQQPQDGKEYQVLIAETNVFFRTAEFFGYADVVKYDESKEQIILEGLGGNLAAIYKRDPVTKKQSEMKGRVIIYDRRTGEFKGSGANLIRSSSLGGPRDDRGVAHGGEARRSPGQSAFDSTPRERSQASQRWGQVVAGLAVGLSPKPWPPRS